MRIFLLFALFLVVVVTARQAGRNEVRLLKDNKSKFLRDGCSSLPKGCSCIEGKDDNGKDIVRVYEGSKCFQYKASGFAKIQTETEDAIEF